MTRYLALDFETAGLTERYKPGTVWCYSLADGNKSTSYRWSVDTTAYLQELACDTDVRFIMHNAAFDVGVARTHGVDIRPDSYEDTMCMFYSLYPGQPADLDNVAWQFLRRRKLPKVAFTQWTPEMAVYNEADAELTFDVYQELRRELDEWPNAAEMYETTELPYIERIIEMQAYGIYINRGALLEEIAEQEVVVHENYVELLRLFPRGVPPSQSHALTRKYGNNLLGGFTPTVQFNPDSPDHVIYACKQLNIPITGVTKNGKPQVDGKFLETADTPFTDTLLKYRKSSKFLTSFLRNVETRTSIEQPRLHGSFKQFHVKTGRLSAAQPNLQNVPARDERGAKIRRMFVAEQGRYLYVGDLDRIELVVLGYELERYLGYTTLSDRIKSGEDVHQSNTDEWGVIAKKLLTRKRCKNGIFATVYGCGVNKFAATIGIDVSAAKVIFQENELMVAIKQLREIMVQEAVDGEGFFENCMGRNLYVPDIMSRNSAFRAAAERQVFNYRIQSAAGDVFKMLQNNAAVTAGKLALRLLIVVHDEAVYETPDMSHIPEDEHESILDADCNMMSNLFSSDTILSDGDVWAAVRCKFHWGSDWYDAKQKGE